MHLPTVARSPISASVSKTTSVSCTVSIVRAVVVPESSSSAAASRVAARSVDGRVRRFHRPDPAPQPLEQRHVVGVAAEERLAEVDVRLDEAGKEVGAAGVDRRGRTARPAPRRPTTMRPPPTATAPSTIVEASFIVRMVALRMRVVMAAGSGRES